MKPKYQHIGKGPPVVDSSGWRLGPGDPPASLPNGADATVLSAVRSGILVKVEAIEIAVKPDDTEQDVPMEEKVKRDDRGLLKVIMKLAIDADEENVLTKTGKPQLDYLRDEMKIEGGDPLFVTTEIRDELFEEITNEA